MLTWCWRSFAEKPRKKAKRQKVARNGARGKLQEGSNQAPRLRKEHEEDEESRHHDARAPHIHLSVAHLPYGQHCRHAKLGQRNRQFGSRTGSTEGWERVESEVFDPFSGRNPGRKGWSENWVEKEQTPSQPTKSQPGVAAVPLTKCRKDHLWRMEKEQTP